MKLLSRITKKELQDVVIYKILAEIFFALCVNKYTKDLKQCQIIKFFKGYNPAIRIENVQINFIVFF